MDSVQVAVRVRPLVTQELESGCRSCIDVLPEAQQIITKLKRDKFTFNHVFDSNTPQVDVYESAIRNLVQQLFKGYNVTVLAYGQTGSGKTYSMGTCPSSNQTDSGIIPRAIADIFDVINNDDEWIFKVTVSFLELYNEQLIDLLSNKSQSAVVELRESNRGICIPGLTQLTAQSADDILRYLHDGSLSRTTGATAMNAQSSRSHAIFTIYIHQARKKNEDDAMSAKFHLVDLAGSERSKKTKAEGKRFQEGVNINKELFVLGNVISALCDNAPFVNYRDSKLTRLLQDSLGGNSLTLMLACVSPADSNLDETVNTLRYADRARKIKNKPVVNQDPNKEEINRLRREIEDLQLALLAKQGDKSCPPEHQVLLEKNQILAEKNKKLAISLDSALTQTTSLLERALMAEAARDKMNTILSGLNVEFANTMEEMESTLNDAQKTNMQALKTKLDELKNENDKSEIERIKYEEHLCVTSLESSPCPKNETKPQSTGEDDEATEEFLFHQAKLNKEIQDLSKDLAWKEALAAKLAESNTMEASIKHGNEEDIGELKAQINSLIHEKEELEQQLKNHRNSNIDHKLAEQRRKRVKELEEKITALNKKVIDQDRIIKMKEKNEEKIKTLNKEIMSMKQMKVRLINQMKSDGEKYRQWRSTREQEMCKLRQQNRQKETKFVKMETYYQKQQTVYKRKLEESASVIRRLKDTLALQKNAKDKRSLLGNTEKVNHWVSQEFTAMVNTLEAERTLDNLIEDRSLLAKELAQLKDSLREPNLQEDERNKIESQIKSLDEDLELRSTQIVDLKQKLQSLDSYQENKSKNRWDCIQTMADAKIALKYVFETANTYLTELHKDKSSKESALNELQDSYNAVVSQLAEKEELLKQETLKLKRAESDHSDKVFVLLNKLKEQEKVSKGSTIPLQDLNNVNDENAKKIIQQQQQKIEDLEKQLEKRKGSKSKSSKASDNWNAVLTPKTTKQFFEESDEDLENLDDSMNDPDWRNTPIYRRLLSLKSESRAMPVKRNIDGQPSCGCRGDCSTRLCSCRKLEAQCSGNCRCEDESCKNKVKSANDSNKSLKDESPSSDGDVTFKKPRLMPDLKPAVRDVSSS
ncbi:chromosome-associated kinesin KIF4A [Homalodisca vitripennis]|uniref:chromosome-associated kinesin KIF4A n=1 Tax=Homalodisca vitripennis TaxID=197043 RepID=UPI001EE9B805|nr:chromosome-associated kinesin KIF4A [Homalodisca vitripennis]